MGKNDSVSVMFYFADRLFFGFLRSLSPGGECLIELKHWRICLVCEIEFLDEFFRLTWTMHWTLRSILSTSLIQTVGQTCLSFCRMSVTFGMSQRLFFFQWYGYANMFLYGRTIFLEGWLIFPSDAYGGPEGTTLLLENVVSFCKNVNVIFRIKHLSLEFCHRSM